MPASISTFSILRHTAALHSLLSVPALLLLTASQLREILFISSTSAESSVQLQLVLSPPHTPQSSSTLPKQSQSPSAIPLPPHLPHSSKSKVDPQVLSQPDGPGSKQPQPASSEPSQPHTPHASLSKEEPQPSSQPEAPC